MKKTFLTLCLGTLFSTAMMAQTQVMNVVKTDGTKVTYKVSEVERVLFEEEESTANGFTVTTADGTKHYADIQTLFHNPEANSWGDQAFAFGDAASAATVADLTKGTYAVQLQLPTEMMGEEQDLANHAGEYTFTLYDYANTALLTEVSAGKVTAKVSDDGSVYLKLEGVTLSDGSTVDGEYSGAATSVSDLSDMKPTLNLTNQYAHNYDVTDIKSVVLSETSGYYTIGFYKEEGVTSFDDENGFDPLASLMISSEALGQDVELSGESETAMLQAADWTFMTLQGTLRVAFDRMKKNITVSLNATEGASWAGDHTIRIEYSGSFATTYQTTDELVINDAEGEELLDKYISSVLRQQPAETGGTTVFGLGDANASTAEGFLKGKYGVQFSVSAAKLNGTIDLATETDSYNFKLIDYATGTYEEEVTSGTITTNEKDGKVYILLDVTMKSGKTVQFDYFEEVTDVTDLSPMIPQLVVNNQFIYYDADGNVSDQKTISTLKYKKSSTYTTFYFVPEGASTYEEGQYLYTPQLQLNNDWLVEGTKTYDLSTLKDGDLFKFYFKDMQLTSPDSKYYGYSCVPDNGTLTVTIDADGNYDFRIEVTNHYTYSGSTGGNNVKAIVSYKGAAVAK